MSDAVRSVGRPAVFAGRQTVGSMETRADEFQEAISRNSSLLEVLRVARTLELPGWLLAGGCLFQTVWNVVTGKEPDDGILDYDLFYFDDSDLSWEAEDAVIRRSARAFAGCAGTVEVRNEARVHLWYEDKFGTPCTPFTRTEDAIDAFIATTCCVGIREDGGGSYVYAPHGFDDIFDMILRPNPVLAPRSVYEAKSERWTKQWPSLRVMPWPNDEV